MNQNEQRSSPSVKLNRKKIIPVKTYRKTTEKINGIKSFIFVLEPSQKQKQIVQTKNK